MSDCQWQTGDTFGLDIPAHPEALRAGGIAFLDCAFRVFGVLDTDNHITAISAETPLWDQLLDQLLAHFAREFAAAGGPNLDIGLLRRQLTSYSVATGVAWLLDALAERAVPGLATVVDRYDLRTSESEVARTQLLMLTNFLNLWQGKPNTPDAR